MCTITTHCNGNLIGLQIRKHHPNLREPTSKVISQTAGSHFPHDILEHRRNALQPLEILLRNASAVFLFGEIQRLKPGGGGGKSRFGSTSGSGGVWIGT